MAVVQLFLAYLFIDFIGGTGDLIFADHVSVCHFDFYYFWSTFRLVEVSRTRRASRARANARSLTRQTKEPPHGEASDTGDAHEVTQISFTLQTSVMSHFSCALYFASLYVDHIAWPHCRSNRSVQRVGKTAFLP